MHCKEGRKVIIHAIVQSMVQSWSRLCEFKQLYHEINAVCLADSSMVFVFTFAEKKPKVEPMPGMMMTGSDGRQHRVYVTVRRPNATRPKFQKSKSVVEENVSSAPRPKMNKSFSTASSNGVKTTPTKQGSVDPDSSSPQGIRAG